MRKELREFNPRIPWMLTFVVLFLVVPAGLWLASYLISNPEQFVLFADEYGVFFWVGAIALIFLGQVIRRLARRRLDKPVG